MKSIGLAVCLAVETAYCADDTAALAQSYPIDFSYNCVAFNANDWNPVVQNETITYTSPDNCLRVIVSYHAYADYPVVEIRPVLECAGDVEAGIVDGFKSLHLVRPAGENVKIRRVTGSRTAYTDFTHHDVQLQRRHECDWLHMTTDDSSSSAAWLPYFGVDMDPRNGMEIAIGWSGTWRADMQLAKEYWLKLGLDACHFRMRKGERFMMPSVLVYERRGKSVEEGLVEFHRFIMAHKAPKDSRGAVIRPWLPVTASGGNKTDANMLKILDFAVKRFDVPFDVFWVDANWYGSHREIDQNPNCGPGWYEHVGDWKCNTWAHPDGSMKKISDAVHRAGMRFLLWFEPERAAENAPIVKEHPEFFLRVKNNPSASQYLLDLGNPDAWQWITDTVDEQIKLNGVDIYRQDFNFGGVARQIWRDTEEPDRIGAREIGHINGLYAFWDELKRRNPDLWFENCASGGRRLDFEMMSRAHAYCRDDAQMFQHCDELTQNITLNSTPYIPFTGGETFTVPVYDDYAMISRFGAGVVFTPSDFNGMIIRREPDEAEIAWFSRMFRLADRMRQYYLGDFYALTQEAFDASDIYCAYQLNHPELEGGFCAVFRRQSCPQDSFHLQLRGIDRNATYLVEEFGNQPVEMTGAALADQWLHFAEPRTVKVIFYSKNH